MSLNEVLILIGAMYLVLGSLTLSGVTLRSGFLLSPKDALFALFCWPYYSYRGLRILLRRSKQ